MSVRFDASSDSLHTSATLPSITSFTMMARIKLTADRNATTYFLRLGRDDGYGHYVIGCNSDGTTLYLLHSSASTNGSALTVGTWYHVAMTVAGTGAGQFLGYLDGVLNITMSGSTDPTATEMWVSNHPDGNLHIDGCIQDIMVYNRVLTAAEILQQTRQRLPVSTLSLNRWSPCHTAADAATVYAGTGGDWTVGGTLATEDGPGIPWSTDENTIWLPPAVAAGKVTKNTRAYPLGMQRGYPRRQGLVR